MKYMLASLIFSMVSYASANTMNLEVDVPADAKSVKVTAFGVAVDTCNKHSLDILQGWGAATGKNSIVIISTVMGCMTPTVKYVDLSAQAPIDDSFGQPKSISFQYESEQISNMKIEFL